MGSIAATLIALAPYVSTAAAIAEAALKIGLAAEPIAEKFLSNVQTMLNEQRGPTDAEQADIDNQMMAFQAQLDALAAS